MLQSCRQLSSPHAQGHASKYSEAISIAPMLNYTNQYFRYLMRLITKHALLYTEMIACNSLLHGETGRYLSFDPLEHPIAIQLGGDHPQDLSYAAKLAEARGFDEINFNVGCPSPRVQAGNFGARLMLQPQLVEACMQAMQDAVDVPVTIKIRLGIDNAADYDDLINFIERIAGTGCKKFIIHARLAYLKKSPKENRQLPILEYEKVYQVKKIFKNLNIILNGGVKTIESIEEHLQHVDGVMIGREAYRNPYLLSVVDKIFFQDDHEILSRELIIKKYLARFEDEFKKRKNTSGLIRPLLGLFHGEPNAKAWKQYLSQVGLEFTAKGANCFEQFIRYFD